MNRPYMRAGEFSLEQKRALAAQLLRRKTEGGSGATPLVHELFEAQVEREPEALAVTDAAGSLSYRELNSRADHLAHELRRHGIGAEALVGLCLSRSTAMLVGLLGVLKAGGAYVPLDPDFPSARLAFMLDDARPAVLLTEQRLRERIPLDSRQAEQTRVLCLDDPRDVPPSGPHGGEAYAASGPTPDNLAYVIYTSGSTGRPKGVQVTHRNLAKFLIAMRGLWEPSERDTLLAVTTLSFDIAALELFLPLIVGARIAIVDRAEAMDGARLAERLGDPAITLLQATPATWRLLLEAGWTGSTGLSMLCGGEPLPRALADRLLDKGKALWNLYGPTETTVWSSASRVEAGDDAPAIGQPIADTHTYVLDGRHRPVPVGVTGELFIGGAGVARGYRERPALTAERFIPDPFGRTPGGRLYRTGDLARWRADGTMECLGRIDQQVKVRGFRIELGEVESALLKHPAVQAAAVLAHADATGELGLVAYIVGRTGLDVMPGPAELRRSLLETLPDYMVPSAFLAIDALPLTPNGKIDRKALPDPGRASARVQQGDGVTLPRGPIEEAVAGIWAELLGCGRVGVHDNFFELGGHSLFAVQVQARLRQTFGVEPSLRDFLDEPTVARLSRLVARALADGAGVQAPPIARTRGERPPQASFAQQRLWFLDRLDPGHSAYNIPTAVRLDGDLDVNALERAINEIVRRHDVLRTTFDDAGGVPTPVVAPELTIALRIEDLGLETNDDEDGRETLARDRFREEAERPFDLSRGPLLRARLLRLGDRMHIIQVTMHHIVADGWSLGVLIREIASLYEAFRRDEPSPLPELVIQYADYAEWQREWLQGDTLRTQLDYWKGQLAEVPSLELPTDSPRGSLARRRGGQRTSTLPATLIEAVKTLGRREGATLFVTLLAAFQVLLHRYSGQTDIAVGSPIAGRTLAELEDLIGLFVNTLVLRGDLSGDPGFRALLRRIRKTALDAYAHQDLPFDQLVGDLQLDRDASRPPLFQVLFALQNQPVPVVRTHELELTPIDATGGTAKVELSLYATETPDGLRASIEYDADLFDGPTIDRMLMHFQTLLEAIVARPDQPIGALPMLSDNERRRMLFGGDVTTPEHLLANLGDLGGDELDALLNELSAEGVAIDE